MFVCISEAPVNSDNGRRRQSDDDMFLYTLAMITAMLLFVAIMASAMFLCFKKYKYICRISSPSAAACQHTLAMEGTLRKKLSY